MITKLFVFVAISAGIYLTIAVVLILSSRPTDTPGTGKTLNFDALGEGGAQPAPTQAIDLPGGWAMPYRTYGDATTDGPLVVLVHGSGWHGGGYEGLATTLANGGAEVLLPDLRGHGATPQRRGDVDYIGQMEDDLAALISANRRPGQKVVMAGHSSGGGLVIRFAGGKHGSMLDGAILMPPFLKYNAPTARPNSGGWARPLTRRIIGLTMLNTVGIRWLNGLTAIQFAFPAQVLSGPMGDTATSAYSFRLNTGYAPRSDYLADVASLPRFLLIAGKKDEAFVADAYEPTMSAVTDKGAYHLIPGVGHLDVFNNATAGDVSVQFLRDLGDKPD